MDNSPEDGPCEVTITAPDRIWLQMFVRQLVENRLAAAAHVDAMHTTYQWAGDVHEADEARAILHTSFSQLRTIVERTQALHPYDVACVAAAPIAGGDARYLAWIEENTVG